MRDIKVDCRQNAWRKYFLQFTKEPLDAPFVPAPRETSVLDNPAQGLALTGCTGLDEVTSRSQVGC